MKQVKKKPQSAQRTNLNSQTENPANKDNVKQKTMAVHFEIKSGSDYD